MVPALSKEVGGARRWLTFAGFSLQPSEIAKFTVILFIAVIPLMVLNIKRFQEQEAQR